MAKQAARRKPGAKREAAWPETEGAEGHGADVSQAARPAAVLTGATALTSIGAARARKRGGRERNAPEYAARGATIDAERDAAIAMGEALLVGFSDAVQLAIKNAHAAGLAVPGRENGVPVEYRPDGEIRRIEDSNAWSPESWKGSS